MKSKHLKKRSFVAMIALFFIVMTMQITIYALPLGTPVITGPILQPDVLENHLETATEIVETIDEVGDFLGIGDDEETEYSPILTKDYGWANGLVEKVNLGVGDSTDGVLSIIGEEAKTFITNISDFFVLSPESIDNYFPSFYYIMKAAVQILSTFVYIFMAVDVLKTTYLSATGKLRDTTSIMAFILKAVIIFMLLSPPILESIISTIAGLLSTSIQTAMASVGFASFQGFIDQISDLSFNFIRMLNPLRNLARGTHSFLMAIIGIYSIWQFVLMMFEAIKRNLIILISYLVLPFSVAFSISTFEYLERWVKFILSNLVLQFLYIMGFVLYADLSRTFYAGFVTRNTTYLGEIFIILAAAMIPKVLRYFEHHMRDMGFTAGLLGSLGVEMMGAMVGSRLIGSVASSALGGDIKMADGTTKGVGGFERIGSILTGKGDPVKQGQNNQNQILNNKLQKQKEGQGKNERFKFKPDDVKKLSKSEKEGIVRPRGDVYKQDTKGNLQKEQGKPLKLDEMNAVKNLEMAKQMRMAQDGDKEALDTVKDYGLDAKGFADLQKIAETNLDPNDVLTPERADSVMEDLKLQGNGENGVFNNDFDSKEAFENQWQGAYDEWTPVNTERENASMEQPISTDNPVFKDSFADMNPGDFISFNRGTGSYSSGNLDEAVLNELNKPTKAWSGTTSIKGYQNMDSVQIVGGLDTKAGQESMSNAFKLVDTYQKQGTLTMPQINRQLRNDSSNSQLGHLFIDPEAFEEYIQNLPNKVKDTEEKLEKKDRFRNKNLSDIAGSPSEA